MGIKQEMRSWLDGDPPPRKKIKGWAGEKAGEGREEGVRGVGKGVVLFSSFLFAAGEAPPSGAGPPFFRPPPWRKSDGKSQVVTSAESGGSGRAAAGKDLSHGSRKHCDSSTHLPSPRVLGLHLACPNLSCALSLPSAGVRPEVPPRCPEACQCLQEECPAAPLLSVATGCPVRPDAQFSLFPMQVHPLVLGNK